MEGLQDYFEAFNDLASSNSHPDFPISVPRIGAGIGEAEAEVVNEVLGDGRELPWLGHILPYNGVGLYTKWLNIG